MTTASIKVKLHDYIDSGDEKLLKLMYAIAKEYSNNDDNCSFSKEDLALFEERRNRRLKGESKIYNWSEAKARITGKKSA